MSDYVPTVGELLQAYVEASGASMAQESYYAEQVAEFERGIAKVYADGMRSVADWIDGGTPRAYGFEHPCDPPGVRTEPSEKERELMGIADATREAASRIEEKAGRIEEETGL